MSAYSLTHRTLFKAQEDNPTAQLSSKGVTEGGHFKEWKDTDLV